MHGVRGHPFKAFTDHYCKDAPNILQFECIQGFSLCHKFEDYGLG
jgi:hypothetical protein